MYIGGVLSHSNDGSCMATVTHYCFALSPLSLRTMNQTKPTSSHSLRTFLAFLVGFVACKAYDQLFFMEGLCNRGVISSNEQKVITQTTAHTHTIPSSSSDETLFTFTSSTTRVSSTSSKEEDGFAAIVKTAYAKALEPINAPSRPLFDLTWWQTESGLNTTGGLYPNDRAMLGQIYRDANSVFEYGLGESTYIANYVKVPRYAGTDSDPVWVGIVRDKVEPHFRFYLSDIGPTKEWGLPLNESQKNILNYQLGPLITEPKPFDVYMVDGRWRLPCLIASFLHASARGAPHTKTIGLIHDCDIGVDTNRIGYHLADGLLTMIQHSGAKLCVYQRKPETTNEQLQKLWHQYMNELQR